MDGKLGDMLDSFYIPPNTSEQELMAILLDIPDGVIKLRDVMKKYDEGESTKNPEQFPGILYVKSKPAGKKLYPLVGF